MPRPLTTGARRHRWNAPDAVICCAAGGPLVSLESATDQEFAAGLQAKLLGQVALARRALRHLRGGGSVVLTGGTFTAPLAGGSLGALVNAGLEGFVRNAAAELPRGLRINVIENTGQGRTIVPVMSPPHGVLAHRACRRAGIGGSRHPAG
ncbi:SDR family oxidoreductase [Nonomuraea maritima]|uniref:SDR family oxidoreductase n=1 Tax=Nonomuraea maritima TaxID=683260 RepID=UPI00371D4562